jgi:hypothetical protein
MAGVRTWPHSELGQPASSCPGLYTLRNQCASAGPSRHDSLQQRLQLGEARLSVHQRSGLGAELGRERLHSLSEQARGEGGEGEVA